MADDQEYLVRLRNPRDVSTDFATVVLKNAFEIEGIQAARVVAIARRYGSCQLAMGSRSNIEKRVNRVNDACRRNGCTLRFEICQRADPAVGGRL